ncbi:NAD-dependent epimerase/dehydratase family protein [Ammoniphilus resinae]|uniref:Nucleoside-diphosphate-sugar epimerase n=1 Tax=Ammoniphilus resinae TaxID=861532 RepID=A0ABS4GTY7_9BACL|nr:NAD(P)-dependent oxidoreductase [Ammoniphilus resinae]MBP1933340.1 nucleoside-diphosphate-sugar epimerase [Ammoniphilus resinae]
MILVTGGFGLIGSNLVRRLSDEGHEVVLFDKKVQKENEFFTNCKHVHFEEGDVKNRLQLDSLIDNYNIDCIVHSAANLNGEYCKNNPVDAVETNTIGTLNLLELARIHKVPKFIYIGSGSIYGTQTNTDPMYESTPAVTMNTYATTKKLSEELVHCYRVNYGLEAVNIRVSWVFGPLPELRQPHWNAPIAYYLWNAIKNNQLHEKSGLDFMANYTYIEDVVEGIYRVIKTPDAPECVHLSSEKMYSNREIIEFIADKIPDCQIQVGEGMDPFVQQAPLRGPLVSEYKEQIGYKPSVHFREALDKYYTWIKKEMDKMGITK